MKVFVSRPLPRDILQPLLDLGCLVDMTEEDCRCSREDLLSRCRGADALLVQATDIVDEEIFDVAPDLKVVVSCSIGYDNIDVEAAKSRGIVICNSPAPDLIAATAEAAVALLLSVAKRITRLHTGQRELALPPYSILQPMGLPVRAGVSGIVGMGRIGSAIARIMKFGFDNSILYFSRSAKPEYEELLGAKRRDLDELLAESDFIFVVVPLTDTTRNLIGRKNVKNIRPNAVVVNIARAGIIDDAALLQRLSDGHIFGAGLDVYYDEAVQCEHPNLVLTAHMANGEDKAMRATAALAVRNIAAVLEDNPPITPVA